MNKAVGVIAVLSLLQVVDGQSCSLNFPAAVNTCMQPFLSPSPTHIFLEGIFMDEVDTDLLNTACRQRKEVDACVKMVSYCSNPLEVPEWIGLNDSLTYVCGEGKEAFENYQKCTTHLKPVYETVFKLCLLHLPPIVNKMSQLESCRHTLGEYSCYVNSSKMVCDSEEFMINYCSKLHQPMKAPFACKFDYKKWDIEDLNMKCNISKAAECMSAFSDKGQYKVFTDGSIMTTPISSSYFTEACRAFNNSKICFNTTGRCKYHELASYWGIVESMEYLCANKAYLEKYQSCAQNGAQTFQQKVNNCQRTLPDITNNNIAGQLCRRQNGLYNCYVQAAKETCDSELFITSYFKKLNQPLQTLKDCFLDNTRLPALSYSQCDFLKLNSCISKIKVIHENLLDFSILPLSATQMREHCMTAYDAHLCVQDQAMCTDMDRVQQIYWTYIRNFWNYICLDNKEGFNRYQKCLVANMDRVEREFMKCHEQDINPDDDAIAKCRYTNIVHKCLEKQSQLICLEGKFAKNYFYNHNKDLLKANYSCILDYSRGASLVGEKNMFTFVIFIAASALVFFKY